MRHVGYIVAFCCSVAVMLCAPVCGGKPLFPFEERRESETWVGEGGGGKMEEVAAAAGHSREKARAQKVIDGMSVME